MTAVSLSEARKRLSDLIDDVARSHEPLHIVGKNRSGVLLSEEDWRSIRETLYLSSIPGIRQSIVEGLATPVEDCTEDIGR